MFVKYEIYLLMRLVVDVYMVYKMFELIYLFFIFVKFDKYGVFYFEGILLLESVRQ